MRRSNDHVAEIFHRMADLLQANRENPHRVRAYRRAATTLLALEEDLETVAQRGELQDIPGIGQELAKKIQEFLKEGTIHAYESLKQPLPAQIAEWATLPGLSEPLVQLLYFKLGLRSLEDLATLVRTHMLRTVPSFSGDEASLLEAIERRLTTTHPGH